MFVAVGSIQQNNKLHFSRQSSINPRPPAVCLENATITYCIFGIVKVYVATLQQMLPICLYFPFFTYCVIHSPLLKVSVLLTFCTHRCLSP